jgi:hypothetical protein
MRRWTLIKDDMKPLSFQDLNKLSPAKCAAIVAHAGAWRMQDPGEIGLFAWEDFRDAFGLLSVREKLPPTHRHRELDCLRAVMVSR